MNDPDRIRLKLNPTNVSVPAGYGDIYFKNGQLVIELPGGVIKPVGAAKEPEEEEEPAPPPPPEPEPPCPPRKKLPRSKMSEEHQDEG